MNNKQQKYFVLIEIASDFEHIFLESERIKLFDFIEQHLTKTGSIAISPDKGSYRKAAVHLTWKRCKKQKDQFLFSLSSTKPQFKIIESTNRYLSQIFCSFVASEPTMKNKIHQRYINVVHSMKSDEKILYFDSEFIEFY